MDFLLDNWSTSGSKMDDFQKQITEISNRTFVVPVNLARIQLMTVCGNDSLEDRVRLQVTGDGYTGGASAVTGLKKSAVLANGGSTALLDELSRSKLVLRIDGSVYFTSAGLSRDLAARAGFAGDAAYDTSHERNMFLAYRFSKAKEGAFATCRKEKEGKIVKIFALGSSHYGAIDQTILLDIIDVLKESIGEPKMKHWYIDHNISQCVLSFPQKAADIAAVYGKKGVKIPEPCMLLETSDTGYCSLTATAMWKTPGGNYIRAESYSRKHYGLLDPEKILSDISGRVWATYTKLPERLCELALIECPDPADLLEAIFESKIGGKGTLSEVIGKRAKAPLYAALCAEFVPGYSYTAYDVVMNLLSLPTRLELTDNREVSLAEALYKVPFLPIEKLVKPVSVALSPA